MVQETSYKEVCDDFLSLVNDDLYGSEEDGWSQEATYADAEILLNNAKLKFFLPKEDVINYMIVDSEVYFTSQLSAGTIQILTLLMVREWLARQLNSVRITEMQFSGSDAKALNTKSQAEAIKIAQDANKSSLREAYEVYRYQTVIPGTSTSKVTDLQLSSMQTSGVKTRGSSSDGTQ